VWSYDLVMWGALVSRCTASAVLLFCVAVGCFSATVAGGSVRVSVSLGVVTERAFLGG
jgi:hypothetical protein